MAAGYAQSGKINDHTGAYSKCFAAGTSSGTDLTNVNPQARCSASGLFVLVTDGATFRLRFKDTAGNDVDTGTPAVAGLTGAHLDLTDFACSELTANVGCIVWVYWHPNGAR